MADIVDKKIEVGAAEVHLLAAGESPGPAIILLHGMKFQAETWQELGTLEILAGAGWRPLAVDLPGFGKSPAGAESPATVLKELIRQEKLERPVLLGPSMGGRIGLEFILDFPELVGGLILVGSVGVEENRARLAAIKVPCLVVWGGTDEISPLGNGHLLVAEIDNARLVVIEGAPHPCYLAEPDIFHREVVAFLEELRGPA